MGDEAQSAPGTSLARGARLANGPRFAGARSLRLRLVRFVDGLLDSPTALALQAVLRLVDGPRFV